jgi:DNA-binding protein Fis
VFSELDCNEVTLPEAKDLFERWFVARRMGSFGFNQCKTAKALGIHRNTLSRKLKIWRWELRRRRFSEAVK